MEMFKSYMKNIGWNVELSDTIQSLPSNILSRYGNIPSEYMSFIGRIKSCRSSDDTTWFISPIEFAESDPEKWRYNEFELTSLEAAADDLQWCHQIVDFWNNHLPIIMSVNDGYSYYALSINNGSVVRGFEPEFEETETVSSSFEEFICKIISGEVEI